MAVSLRFVRVRREVVMVMRGLFRRIDARAVAELSGLTVFEPALPRVQQIGSARCGGGCYPVRSYSASLSHTKAIQYGLCKVHREIYEDPI